MEDVVSLIRRAEQALVGFDVPPRPRDGDCLRWEPLVTARLLDAGLAASGVVVVGWADWAGRVLAFVHRATLLAGRVVADCTARQFGPALPQVWVGELPAYTAALAAAAGVPEVTVTPGQGRV